jgi:hypothetical protein
MRKTLFSSLSTASEILDFSKSCLGKPRPNGIGADTWAKIIRVASTSYLYRPGVLQFLPNSFSTISQISLLSEKDFNTALGSGVIRSDLSYREMSKWRKMGTGIKLKVVPVLVVVSEDEDYGQVVDAVRRSVGPDLGVVVEVDEVRFNTQEVKSKWDRATLEGLVGRFGKSEKAMVQATRYVGSASKQARYGAKVNLLELAEQGDTIAKEVVSKLFLS